MNKLERLEQILLDQKKVTVAYSGGIDSTFLLAEAKKVLGVENVLAVVVNSELFRDSEYDKAMELAKAMDVKARGITIEELADEEIANNTPNGWYRSKKILYQAIREVAQEEGFDVIVDGMIMDDNADFRPGLKARDEENILSALQEADLYKSEIRELSKTMNLPIWDKPASCSVASRFPYYTEITPEKVAMVMQGEEFLNNLGFAVVRLRHHGNIARLEVEESRMADILAEHKQVDKFFKELGFEFVALDFSGYKMGRMNEELFAETAV